MNTGYMQLYTETKNNLASYFDKDIDELCLSGGPIYIDNKYLVAGHLRKGGWGGYRKTFFYTFDANYPNKILEISPVVDFGFSKNLEYCNNIFENDNKVYLSMGVNDKYSCLINTEIDNILKILKPI